MFVFFMHKIIEKSENFGPTYLQHIKHHLWSNYNMAAVTVTWQTIIHITYNAIRPILTNHFMILWEQFVYNSIFKHLIICSQVSSRFSIKYFLYYAYQIILSSFVMRWIIFAYFFLSYFFTIYFTNIKI